MSNKTQTELEKAEIQKLTLLVNVGQFEDLSGEEQMKYIESLNYTEGSDFLAKNYKLLKPDAPAPKGAYFMKKELIELFVERKYPINKDSKFAKNIDISDIDFSEINIIGEQFLQTYGAGNVAGYYKVPAGVDFTGCSFEGKDIIKIDFTQTNITGKQFCQASSMNGCKLPDDIDFTGCSFAGKDIGGIDFSRTNITGSQFCQASRMYDCKLPAGIDFTGCSFEGKDISLVDFSRTNITLEQIRQADSIYECKFPKGIKSLLGFKFF